MQMLDKMLFWIGILLVLSIQPCTPGFPETFKCVLDKEDRLDKNLAEVMVRPKDFLKGPTAKDQSVGELHFVIAGAGIAGLISSYMLLEVGHKVTILESSNRAGGRIKTYYGQDWYADLGAMRFPPQHFQLRKMLQFFNVPIQVFTNRNEGMQGNYFFINGKYFSSKDVITLPGQSVATNDTALRELYAMFRIPEEGIPKEEGRVLSPWDLVQDILRETLKVEASCAADTSLYEFLRVKLAEKNLNPHIIQLWAIMQSSRDFLPLSIDEFINDSDQKFWKNHTKGQPFVEVVGGAQVIPERVLSKLKKHEKFTLLLNSQVKKVTHAPGNVTATYLNLKTRKTAHMRGNFMILTPTTKAQSLIEFSPPLDYRKMNAFEMINYVNAIKIFLKFSEAWWSWGPEKGNKAVPIVFDTVPGKKAGATGITDSKLTQIYYPSFPNHGTSIIASYSWSSLADFWHSMTEEEAIDYALNELEKIHGPIVRKHFQEGIVYMWNKNRHARGGFIHRMPYQKYNLVRYLIESQNQLIFSGEYASKENNGWVEAAITSATRNLVNMWPEAYEKEFGQEEEAFLKRHTRRVRRHKRSIDFDNVFI